MVYPSQSTWTKERTSIVTLLSATGNRLLYTRYSTARLTKSLRLSNIFSFFWILLFPNICAELRKHFHSGDQWKGKNLNCKATVVTYHYHASSFGRGSRPRSQVLKTTAHIKMIPSKCNRNFDTNNQKPCCDVGILSVNWQVTHPVSSKQATCRYDSVEKVRCWDMSSISSEDALNTSWMTHCSRGN